MERERFEQLIIDYIEGTLNRQEEDEFLSAMTEHEEYREIYDQYVSIHNIMETEDDISPSEAVLNSINEYARHSAKTDNPSIFKKWFTIPVLAPLLGTAIVAMFWFSVGEQYLKNRNIIKVAEVGGSKNNRAGSYDAQIVDTMQKNEPVIAEEQALDFATEKFESNVSEEFDVASSAPASPEAEKAGEQEGYRAGKPEGQIKQEEILPDKKGKSSLAAAPQAPESEARTSYADDQGKEDVLAEMKVESQQDAVMEGSVDEATEKRAVKKENVDAEIATASRTESAIAPTEVVKEESKSPYREQINAVLAQQYQGDCLNSIKASNKVLNSQPEPPKAVKTTLYLSQAECYEELNQIDNAIKAYEKVQAIEPSSTSFFSNKIMQLNMKKVK